MNNLPLTTIKQNAIDRLNAIPEFQLDYFEIADGSTLQVAKNKSKPSIIVACTAVYLANIRLIDNIILKDTSS